MPFTHQPDCSLPLITENLRMLATEYARLGCLDRLTMNITCQRPNISELPKLIELAASCGVKEVKVAPVSAGPTHPLSLVGINTPRVLEIIRESARAAGINATLLASLDDALSNPLDTPACIHPWMYCHVAYDGHIGFCDHLIGPTASEYFLGMLDEASSFESIWNGPAWTTLRAEHLRARRNEAPLFHECAWCYRHRHTDFEDVFVDEAAASRVQIA